MGGQPLFDSPTVSELARTTDEEDAFFAELEQLKEPLRDFAYEQSVRRTYWMNMIGRSTQKVVQRLPLGIGYVFNKVGKAAYMLVMRLVAGKS
jgi:predicted DCC family thiol-disulfide oxidoreductase YuxK